MLWNYILLIWHNITVHTLSYFFNCLKLFAFRHFLIYLSNMLFFPIFHFLKEHHLYEYNHNKSQRDWKFKDNTEFQGNRAKYVNRPVQKHFFCLRCGIPSNQEERNNFQGSDHTTAYCTIYKQYNSFNCSFCLSKNIEAKHFPQDCKQR